MNIRRLERLLALLERIRRAGVVRPSNVVAISDWSPEAVDRAVAERQSLMADAGTRGGLLLVPEPLSREAWDSGGESAVSAAARASHNRPEHDSGRGKG